MTDRQKIQKLKYAFEETIWMAIRYAHGKNTYAPHIIRDAVIEFRSVFPDWEPKPDITIQPPPKDDSGTTLKENYLNDFFGC